MAEQKILISIQVKDDGTPELKKVEGALKGVSKQTENLTKHETRRAQLQQKIIEATSEQAVVEKQLELRLQLANKRTAERAKAAINAAEGQDIFSKSVRGSTAGLQQNRAQSGLNNAILIEMGRTASDAQYGFQGMANNIGRLVELGQEFARTGSGGLKGALSTLGKSIMGTGGILIAVQLLISFLPTLQKKFKDWKDGTKGVNDATKELIKTYEELNEKLGENNKALVNKEKIEKNLIALSKQIEKNDKRSLQAQVQGNENIRNRVRLLQRLGLQIDETKVKEDGYIDSLIKGLKTSEEVAKELDKRRTALDVAKRKREISPVEAAEAELQLFVDTQEALLVSAETYINSREYQLLLADLDKAKQEAEKKREQERIDAEVNRFEEEFKRTQEEIAARRKVLEEFEIAARKQKEGEPTYIEEDGIEDFESQLTEFDTFLSKFVTKKEKYDEDAERAAIEMIEILGFELAGFRNIEEAKDAIHTFFSEKRIQQSEKEKRQRIRAIKQQQEAELAYSNTAQSLANLFKALGKENEGLQIAGVVAETAANISKIITNTNAANAIAKVIVPPLGQPFVTLNNISAGLGVATSLVSARNAIKDIKSGNLSGGGVGSKGGGTTIQAPDFNIVGASQTSQLAQTVAGQQAKPVKAFVVGKDISTQQELDRNITNTASFG